MTRIDFYHLQKSTLEDVLPKLCEKAYSTKMNIKILLGNDERVDFINSLLWTYSEESFLPHGSAKDGFVDLQPIFISTENTNENKAQILILADGVEVDLDSLTTYSRVLYIFDGNNEMSLSDARNYWKQIKSASFELHYWQQNASGNFEQKV